VLLHNKVAEFRKQMTDRELEIFDQRIFSDTPVTLQDIGDRYGISRAHCGKAVPRKIPEPRPRLRRKASPLPVSTGRPMIITCGPSWNASGNSSTPPSRT
jgi:hypothetical protein